MKVFDILLKTIDPFSPILSLTFHIFHLKFSQMFAAFILLFATTVILPITVNAYFCFSMYISLLFTLTIYNVTLVPFSRPVAIYGVTVKFSFIPSITAPQDAHIRLVLQVYLGSNSLV